MNGQALSPDRGFPIRLVIPGIYGMRWVKWVDRITVSLGESPNYYQQRDYKILPRHIDTPAKAESAWKTVPAMQYLSLNSAVTLVRLLPEQKQIFVRGYAVSTFTPRERIPIVKMEVSADEGAHWHEAEITYREKWSWTLWETTIPVPEDRESGCAEVMASECEGEPARSR